VIKEDPSHNPSLIVDIPVKYFLNLNWKYLTDDMSKLWVDHMARWVTDRITAVAVDESIEFIAICDFLGILVPFARINDTEFKQVVDSSARTKFANL